MKYCIVFPKMRFWNPIDINGIKIAYVGSYHREFTEFEKQFNDHLPYIFLRHFSYTNFNYSLGYFDSEDDIEAVIKKMYGELLLTRYEIMNEENFPSYSNTEYLLFKFHYNNFGSGGAHYEMFINGLENIPSFTLKIGTLEGRDISPSHFNGENTFGYMLMQFIALPPDIRRIVINGMGRYIAAYVPGRYGDYYSRVLNLASGIEGFLNMEKNRGYEAFGKKLKEMFERDDLQCWGKQFYILSNNHRHQNFDSMALFDRESKESKLHQNKHPDESQPFLYHEHIAPEILRQLIRSHILGGKPSTDIQLYSNELPLKRLTELIGQSIPIGEEHYGYFHSIIENGMGGTIKQKQNVIIFVCRALLNEFPGVKEFDVGDTDLNNSKTSLSFFEKLRIALNSKSESKPICDGNIRQIKLLHESRNILRKLQMSLGMDLAIKARKKSIKQGS